MEPCLFRHGKIIAFVQGTAEELLQWSHVFSDMVRVDVTGSPEIYLRFNGAMSFQTW